MLWAVGARYGYDTMRMKVSKLTFYYRGHIVMAEEEKRVQAETLAQVMGGGK